MILIKDTIARVGKVLLKSQAIPKAPPFLVISKGPQTSLDQPSSSNSKTNYLHAASPEHREEISTPNECKISQQDFLRPLNIPSLKAFDNKPPPYDDLTATENWKHKAGSRLEKGASKMDARSVGAVVHRRHITLNFEKMVNTLFSMAPPSVKATTPFELAQVLEKHTQELNLFRYSVKRHRFDEVPSMPDPLTRHSFEEYIYTLTHLAFHGKHENLQAISNILLDTHKLPGDPWKEFRLEVTFNYLIKYFGYDKNQSAFARQLLLVMNEDGRRINIDTINHLLKVCRTHSQIRSKVDTSVLVIKCLKLAKDFGVDVNLSTFTRVFDTINDASLRELFLQKMKLHKIPILRGMKYRILDDLSIECRSESEFIQHLEQVMYPTDWKQNPVLWNKLVKVKAKLEITRDMRGICIFACKHHVDLSAYTVGSVVAGTYLNKSYNKWIEFYMASRYFHMLECRDLDMSQAPGVYASLVSRAISSELPGSAKNFLIRGILHEASVRLWLPRRKKQNFIALCRFLGGHVTRQIRTLEIQNRCPILQEFHGSERECWETLKHNLLRPVISELEMSDIVHRFIITSEEKMEEKGIRGKSTLTEISGINHDPNM